MARENNEWLKVWGSPKSPNNGKKHLEDYLDESGRYWSTPNTPTSRNRLSREPSFESAQNSQEKPNIMTKVHGKTKKWKQILPYIRKHLNGQNHDNEKRHEEDKAKIGTTSVGSGDAANVEDHRADYLGAPSNAFHVNNSYPRTLYESEIAPKLYRQQSMAQRGSITNSPPRFGPSQSRLAPPQLTRCKSYRPRPGVQSGIEEIEVHHDMTRTKSDPVRLKPVRLHSNEYQPTSFSFPTSPEIQELDDIEQPISNNNKYPSSFSPRFVGNPSSLSPRLVINAHDNKSQASEFRPSNSSNSIFRNNSNEMSFTDYNIIVQEINEILDSPSSLSSKATHKNNDFSEIQSAQDNRSKLYQAVSFPGSAQPNMHNKNETLRHNSANMWNNWKETETNAYNESPTHKVLSEVAHKIAHSQVATNQEVELDTNNDHLQVSFAPTEIKPAISTTEIEVLSDAPDHTKSKDHRTTTFDNSKVASKVGIGIVTHTRFIEEANRAAGSTQNSTSLEINKPINLKPILTKLPVNNPKGSSSNSTNRDDYKTFTEAVTEILTPTYHAMFEAASKIVESARIGTMKVVNNVPDDKSNSGIDVADNGDYKTVTEAVGEMLSPVYTAVSQATNKVAGTGYQKGISLRDYLKSKAVVGNTRIQYNSLEGIEEVPNSPVPVSRNAYTEENEEIVGNGRRLQESTN